MRTESRVLKNAGRIYMELGFETKDVFHNTKLLLKTYRKVCWSMEDRFDELQDFGGDDFETVFAAFSEFMPIGAQVRLESKFSTAYDSKLLIDYVEKALAKLKDYPNNGELYYNILNKQYFVKYKYDEQDLLESLSIERSVFYERKKEAIAMFSIVLWGYLIPEYRDRIWQAS